MINLSPINPCHKINLAAHKIRVPLFSIYFTNTNYFPLSLCHMSSSDWARARKSGGVMQVGFFKPFQVEISSKVFRLLDLGRQLKIMWYNFGLFSTTDIFRISFVIKKFKLKWLLKLKNLWESISETFTTVMTWWIEISPFCPKKIQSSLFTPSCLSTGNFVLLVLSAPWLLSLSALLAFLELLSEPII